ncbi:hypothetical protein [Petroclostridium sp. X23]|uniref:hypothetical protein n=1 Tax=Petroclostridium sp. X23 TaxID=3045146 RepID=UPI0024ADD72D|nr:hypothetical protein [Petroclostridium sp. X23]WHH59148.1 hypothetical protein QKW49_25740 [Petroclostridium sp. X23]
MDECPIMQIKCEVDRLKEVKDKITTLIQENKQLKKEIEQKKALCTHLGQSIVKQNKEIELLKQDKVKLLESLGDLIDHIECIGETTIPGLDDRFNQIREMHILGKWLSCES